MCTGYLDQRDEDINITLMNCHVASISERGYKTVQLMRRRSRSDTPKQFNKAKGWQFLSDKIKERCVHFNIN